MQAPPDPLRYDPATRRLSLDPHAPAFVQDPYAAYRFLNAEGGLFFWEDYGHWCVSGFEAVSRLLRDRRLGRQVLLGHAKRRRRRAASRRPSTPSRPIPCWSSSRPPTRASGRWSTAPSCRARSSGCGRASRAWPMQLDRRLREGRRGRPAARLRRAAPDHRHRRDARRAGRDGRRRCSTGRTAWWPCTCTARPARPRTPPTRPRREVRRLRPRASGRSGASAPGDDLLTTLIAAQEESQKLSEDELVSSVILLLNAGHEATVHQTGNAVRTILNQGGDPTPVLRLAGSRPRRRSRSACASTRRSTCSPARLSARRAREGRAAPSAAKRSA